MAIGRDPTTAPKYLPKPKQALDPTTNKPWPTIAEMEAKGLKAEEDAKQKKIRSFAASLTEAQMEGIRLGENFLGWDSEKKQAYYGTPQPTLRPGKRRPQQVYEQSTAARPQRMVAEGLAELGPVGVPVIGWGAAAAKGAAVGFGLTNNMSKWLGAQKTLKTLDDIPEAFSPRVIADRSRKLFGKNPKQLNAQQQAVVWGDLVDKKKFAPGRKVRGQRDEVRQEAAEKLKTEQTKTARTEEGAGRAATLGKEAQVAEAAGTTTIPVGDAPLRAGSRRAQRTGQTRAAAKAEDTASEARVVDQELRETVVRQADEAQPGPSMAGQTRSADDIAASRAQQQRKAGTKATKKADRQLNKIAKQKLPNEVDEAFVSNLERQIEAAAKTGTPAQVEAARKTLTRAQNKLTNQTQRSTSEAARMTQAAERRAAAKAAEPDDVAAAQATFDEWAGLPDSVVRKKQIGKRAAELAKKPWAEMSALERRNFVHKAAQERPTGATSKPAAEATEEVVEEAAEAAPRPSGRARLEKGAKTAGKVALQAGAGGAAGGALGGPLGAQLGAMAAPAVVEGFKRAPWATGLGTAATGAGVYAATAEERREKEMLDRATTRTADARKKQRGEEKIAASDAADLKARIDELNEKQWYGVDLDIDESGNPAGYPSNWVNAYHELHGAAADAIRKGKASGDPRYAKIRPSEAYKKINRMEDGPMKVEAMAKDFRNIVGMAKSQGYEDLLDVQFDENGTPQDFDVQELLKVMYRVTK